MKTTAFLAGSVVALGIGVAEIAGGNPVGWFLVAFGALGLPVFGFLLARPSRLELDRQGLTTVTLGRRWHVDWHQCGPFRAAVQDVDGSFLGPRRVAFDCEQSDSNAGLALASRFVAGGSATLPDTYGMSATKLAALLNHYREASREEGPTA